MTATGPAPPDQTPPRPRRIRDIWGEWLLVLMLALPYRWRVPLAGWMGGALARFTRLPGRLATGIRHFRPDLPQPEVARLSHAVTRNLARLAVENLSGADFARHARGGPIDGPGLPALTAARDRRRPAILVTAHFGNYDAARAILTDRGFPLAGLYRPLDDPGLNRRYLQAISAVGQPLFANTREGVVGMVRHLRAGGMVGALIDLDRYGGEMLDFLGQPTRTVLSMAQMALRHDALLVPIWGIRQPDGLSFRVQVDAPVPHGDPRAMTQALNDALSAMVRRHPEQWLWWHKRRKPDHP